MKRKRTGLSRTSAMHYAKLVFRSCLLLAALTVYVRHRLRGTGGLYDSFARIPALFCEESNESLRCANCREKLCHHKSSSTPSSARTASASTADGGGHAAESPEKAQVPPG